MESLKTLYKIGTGPSSSHTMGPEKAARLFKEKHKDALSFKVILQGSLAKTGKGHRTDYIIEQTFAPVSCEIVFDMESATPVHPNTMLLYAQGKDKQDMWEVYSIGGGLIEVKGQPVALSEDVYPQKSFSEILEYCKENKLRLWQYAEKYEGAEIWAYLKKIWRTMDDAIERGIETDGVIFGGLDVQRKAKQLYNHRHIDESRETRENRLVCAYAFACSEENASCGTIVTAPTCGSCGVLPAVLKYVSEKCSFSETDIVHALGAAGVIGNVIRTNASISGAECGCQAEIGTACSMAAAALGEMYGMSLNQIEYAAEVALEHHLGLTCDPIMGLVQILCIERNAVAAMRAINAVNLANFLADSRKISFDLVVRTMYETGKDLPYHYRETSEGGLAKLY